MALYEEILRQITALTKKEQNQLFQELKHRLYEVEEDEDDFSPEDLAESESEWQNYLNKRDLGKSLSEIELELLGEKIE